MNLGSYIGKLTGKVLVLIGLTSVTLVSAQQNSVLSKGSWIRMQFDSHGVYKIDKSKLSEMGFDVNTLDPRNLQIHGMKGGMLPQANADYQSLLLQQLSIEVVGEQDGRLDDGDYILFYVDRVDELVFTGQTYDVYKNLYSDEIFYFLTLGTEQGLRISNTPSIQGNLTTLNSYDRIISHEEDLVNILGSGREWYGERFDSNAPFSFSLNTTGVVPNETVLLSVTGMAQSFISSDFDIAWNGQNLGNINFNAIPDARYGIKGNERTRVFLINSEDIVNNTNTELSITYNQNGAGNAVAYLNRFLLNLPTQLSYNDTPFNFRARASLNQSITRYDIENRAENIRIWDVSAPLSPLSQETENISTGIAFGAFSESLHEYSIFQPESVPLVESFESIANQDLSGRNVPNLVIITDEILLPEARRLATFRSEYDDLDVEVVTAHEVYNEFSAGRQDISAIRNYARYLKEQSEQFKYLLFFGKGSYDYKDRIEDNTDFVPTYEARNSLHPLLSYSSDDYFGFLDSDEGLWAESSSGDHLLDIGIGRIPATTLAQAATAVDKIISYQTDPRTLGDWRSKLVFVADDGDRNIHQRDADFLATLIDTTYTQYNVSKLYLDSFEQELRPNGEFSPDAVNALLDAVDQGALIINFTGHGAETGWMQERVLTTSLIDDWDNERKLPLLVTATCEFGRNDDPSIFSGAEKMIFKSDGGALALITTARPVFSSTNYDLNLALYGSILEPSNGEYPRLGDIIMFTKNNSLNGSLNRNFILLGDPSMRIAYPENEIQIETLNGQTIDITRKDTIRALQHVTVTGALKSGAQTATGFNGELKFTLLDKNSTQQTKGTESEVFEYLERNSTLFSGTASVVDGIFQIDFVVPKNINYQFGSGKMTFYATNEEGSADGLGASIDFVIGGTAQEVTSDLTPPVIRPFLNDTSVVTSYVVKPDAELILLLSDENGINISKSGIGQDIAATLNDSVTFVLNDFYTTVIDDFQKGQVTFPMRNLPLGQNTLKIKAWDTHNNPSELSLDFLVTGENSTDISEINAYPNPFTNNMTFAVSHNSAGQAIELVVEIFNQKGEKVRAIYQTNPEAGNIEEVKWNGTDNTGSSLPGGIYIYNVFLRSEGSEMVHSSRQKLIISN